MRLSPTRGSSIHQHCARFRVGYTAQAHKLIGIARTVALQIPSDNVDSFAMLREYAKGLGVALGTINSNTFRGEAYNFGRLYHHAIKVRQQAIGYHLECIEIMHEIGPRDGKIWLANGGNYPGQADVRLRQDWLAQFLRTICESIAASQRLVFEYRFFEKAFYHLDVSG